MKILIISYVVPEVLQALQSEHDVIHRNSVTQDELKQIIVDREVVILRSGAYLTADVLALAPDLKMVIRAGSGMDNIDLPYIHAHNIYLARIPEPGARAVAEIAFGFMISLARQFGIVDPALRQGHWMKTEVEGFLLRGKTLGIIGAGNIGRTVARLANAWDMRVLGCTENYSPERRESYRKLGIELVKVPDVLRHSNFVTLHVPLKDSTRNLIGASELRLMKRGSYLVNLARGGVVDEQALYEHLTSGHIAGCALDVHSREGNGQISMLAGLPNVILTPHIGAQTIDTQVEIGHRIMQIMHDLTSGQNLEQYDMSSQFEHWL